jgi:hypothetical protein
MRDAIFGLKILVEDVSQVDAAMPGVSRSVNRDLSRRASKLAISDKDHASASGSMGARTYRALENKTTCCGCCRQVILTADGAIA